MPVLAFTQEMATLGSDVALGVCEALKLSMVRHEVGDVVAGRMTAQEMMDATLSRETKSEMG